MMTRASQLSLIVIITALAWIVSTDFIVTGLVFIGYGAFFLVIFPRRMAAFTHKCNKETEAFHFISAFIIALSVKNTPNSALEAIQGQLSANLKKEIEDADTIDSQAILVYLKTYFPLPLYEMFVTLIDLHTSQGGSILEMSELLLATGRRNEADRDEKTMISRRRLTNFVILWILTIIVLLFSRFGISSLFEKMRVAPSFQIGIGIYFAFLLYSINTWITRLVQVERHA